VNCKICNRPIVLPSGPLSSKILIVGEFPGHFEFIQGYNWAGPAGKVLKFELEQIGVDLHYCRSTNLWLHEKVIDCDLEWHRDQMYREIVGRDAVLFLGSEVAHEFGVDISKVNGLQVSGLRGVRVAVIGYNPAIVTKEKTTMGELRFAIEEFGRLLNER
jgi:uracil-DNA glycosylase family 4